MTSPQKPKAWTLSPQLTAAPELWRGCVFMVPFWEGVGVPFDIVRKSAGTVGNGSPDWIYLRQGLSSDHSARGAWSFFDNSLITNLGDEMTNLVLMKESLEEATTDSEYIAGKNYGGGNTKWFYITKSSQEPFLGAFFWDDGNDNNLLNGNTEIIDNQPHLLAQTNSLKDNIREVWTDGTLEASGNAISGITNNGPVVIGERADFNASREYRGSILLHAMWNRRLRSHEIQLLTRDPFAMLRPAGF